MIKHIILWRLKPYAEGADKLINAHKAKSLLEGLRGQIPGLLSIEVGIGMIELPDHYDFALYTEFEDEEALAHYQSHPEHVKLGPFMRAIRQERYCIDYRVS